MIYALKNSAAVVLLASAGCLCACDNGTNPSTTTPNSSTTTKQPSTRTPPSTPTTPSSNTPTNPPDNTPQTPPNNPSNPPSPPPGGATGPSAAAQGAVSAETRILSIYHAKDQEEISIGKLAEQRATSDAAKQLAQTLVKDHTEHDAQVTATASAAHVTLLSSQQVGQLLQTLQGAASPPSDPLSSLQNLQGADFDKAFGDAMAQGHHELINITESIEPNITDASVKALVDKTLPTLHHHEEMALAAAK